MKKLLLSVGMAGVLLLTLFSAAWAVDQVVVDHAAYLRTEPALDATKLKLVPSGEKLTVLDASNQYWQKVQTVDGIVGYITTNSYYVKPVTTPAEDSTVHNQLTRQLKKGDTGEEVKQVQQLLSQAGFYQGKLDGEFGALMEKAVIAFQTKYKLVTDGLVGPQTWAKLTAVAGDTTSPGSGGTNPDQLTRQLKKGDTGEEVKQVQQLLSQAGFYQGKLDGEFGALTEKAVIAFQTKYKLVTDGLVGPQTWAKLTAVAGDGATNPGTSTVTTKVLGKGTSWETTMYVIKGQEPGKTVWVSGGIHGNEVAGYKAALQVKDWQVGKGTLLVIPELNKSGIKNNKRNSPYGDLNRAFPQSTKETADNALAKAIWNEYLQYKPDYLLDLHEGYDYHVQNSASVGQSIIYYPKGDMKTYGEKLVAQLNRTTPSSKRFSVLRYPIGGSLARAAGIFGSPAAILETSSKDPLSTRVANQLTAVRMLLEHAGLDPVPVN
ncbi:MAG: peptidoglycan-binding protein [Heliobacteriaceae bacterium]|nr:peptidoglycan-binding protein [Heliobacteriaceae bacterium]